MRYPADIIHDEMDWADEETQVSRMLSEMKLTYKIVEARRRKERQKEEKKYISFKPTEFKQGEEVYIYRPRKVKGIAGKLWLNWVGPYTIVEKLPQGVTYKGEKLV